MYLFDERFIWFIDHGFCTRNETQRVRNVNKCYSWKDWNLVPSTATYSYDWVEMWVEFIGEGEPPLVTVAAVQLMLSWWFLMHETWNLYQLPFIAPHRRSWYSCKPSGGAVSKSKDTNCCPDRSRSLDSDMIVYAVSEVIVLNHNCLLRFFQLSAWSGSCSSIGTTLSSCQFKWLCRFFLAKCGHPTCATVSFSKFLRTK